MEEVWEFFFYITTKNVVPKMVCYGKITKFHTDYFHKVLKAEHNCVTHCNIALFSDSFVKLLHIKINRIFASKFFKCCIEYYLRHTNKHCKGHYRTYTFL